MAAWFLSPRSGESVYQTGAARLTDVNSIQQLSVRKPVSAALVNCVWHLKGGRCKPFIGIFSSAWSVHTKRIIIVAWFIPGPQEKLQVPPLLTFSYRVSLACWFLLKAHVFSPACFLFFWHWCKKISFPQIRIKSFSVFEWLLASWIFFFYTLT